MPEETYNIQLDADQVNTALLNVHGADTEPTAASTKMVQSGGLHAYLEGERQNSGYGVYDDLTTTEVSPLLAANARVQLTIDGDGPATYIEQIPGGEFVLWDDVGNFIQPANDGDAYMMRVSFRYKSNALNSHFDLELDISPTGDGSNVILLDTIQCLKAANTEARYNQSHFIYTRSTFIANGGRLFINSTDAGDTISIYEQTLGIGRIHKAI